MDKSFEVSSVHSETGLTKKPMKTKWKLMNLAAMETSTKTCRLTPLQPFQLKLGKGRTWCFEPGMWIHVRIQGKDRSTNPSLKHGLENAGRNRALAGPHKRRLEEGTILRTSSALHADRLALKVF